MDRFLMLYTTGILRDSDQLRLLISAFNDVLNSLARSGKPVLPVVNLQSSKPLLYISRFCALAATAVAAHY